jgi:hypothetical protein
MSQNYVEKAVVDMAILELLDAYELATQLEHDLVDGQSKAQSQQIACTIEASLRKISCYGTEPTTARYLAKIQTIKERA